MNATIAHAARVIAAKTAIDGKDREFHGLDFSVVTGSPLPMFVLDGAGLGDWLLAGCPLDTRYLSTPVSSNLVRVAKVYQAPKIAFPAPKITMSVEVAVEPDPVTDETFHAKYSQPPGGQMELLGF